MAATSKQLKYRIKRSQKKVDGLLKKANDTKKEVIKLNVMLKKAEADEKKIAAAASKSSPKKKTKKG